MSMKKSLVTAAVLATFSGAALAQSNVTLYGVVDTGYGATKNYSRDAAGVVTKTSKDGLVSGTLSGSRIGFKGQEDLGGSAATFNLEAGFNSATGAFASNGALNQQTGFMRRSTVGLKGAFGHVALGTDTTPLDAMMSGKYQAIDAVTGDTAGELGGKFYTARTTGVHYSKDFGDMDLQAFAGHARVKNGVETKKREGYGVGVGYTMGQFSAQAAVQQFRNKGTPDAGFLQSLHSQPMNAESLTEYGVGASYDFTAAKVMGHVAGVKHKGEKDVRQFGLAVDVPVGAATLGAQYAYNKSEHAQGHDFGARGTYALSKRTDLYAQALRSNSWKVKNTQLKQHTDTYAIGVRHKF